MSADKAKVDIVILKRRDEDLDTLFKRFYEDMVSDRLSPERFDKLSAEYEEEQRKVKQTIDEQPDNAKRRHSFRCTATLHKYFVIASRLMLSVFTFYVNGEWVYNFCVDCY